MPSQQEYRYTETPASPVAPKKRQMTDREREAEYSKANASRTVAPPRPAPVDVRTMGAEEFNGQGGIGVAETVVQSPRGGPLTGDALKAAFGFSMGAPTATTDDASARAGVLAGGYKPTLEDPGAARRAGLTAFGAEIIPARTPTRQESAEEDAYIAAQVAPVQAADERIERGNQRDMAFAGQQRAEDRADAQMSALQRRQALLMTLENQLGIPIDEKSLQEIVKEKFKQDENEGVLADIYTMFEDEQKDIEQIPMGPTAEQQKALIREHYREKRDRLQNIRTRRAVQLSKQPAQADENDILSLVNAPGGS